MTKYKLGNLNNKIFLKECHTPKCICKGLKKHKPYLINQMRTKIKLQCLSCFNFSVRWILIKNLQEFKK